MPDTLNERLLVKEAVIECTRCELHARCTAPVPMHGPVPSSVVVVGEAPGRQEDRQGVPFIGPAGQLIRQHLNEVGLIPDRLGWVNTVSCWPSGTPTPAHVHACRPNKVAQLDVMDPKWVLLLGKVALQATRPDLAITAGRGRPFIMDGDSSRVYFATYHPAYALRNGGGEREMHADLATFAEMVASDDPMAFIPDDCSKCAEPAVWFDQSWLGVGPCSLPEEAERWLKENEDSLRALKLELADAKSKDTPGLVPAPAGPGENDRRLMEVVRVSGKDGATVEMVARTIRGSNPNLIRADLERLAKRGSLYSPTELGRDVWMLSPQGRREGDSGGNETSTLPS